MSNRLARWFPLLLVLAGALVYANTLQVPFLFDDQASIVGNPAIRRLWPVTDAMSSRTTTLVGRPVVSLSLALNYAAGGLAVAGYHLVNLALHLLNGLLVFGVVRRLDTLARRRVAGAAADGDRSRWLAAAVALWWVVHPLATESVTYVVQRTELLVGCFLLLTIYAFLRSLESREPLGWQAVAVVACALGIGSKEVMVVAPLLVLVVDRLFVVDTLAECGRRRGWLYLGLAATWLVLVALLVTTDLGWKTSLAVVRLGPLEYAKTQAQVLVHYLRLSVWPAPLVIDYYDWPADPPWSTVLLPGLGIVALLAATGWGLVRRRLAGFWGAWFFLILAPTSSFVPLPTEPAAERRMYLPLVAVLAVVVPCLGWLLARAIDRARLAPAVARALPAGLVGAVALVLVGTSVRRNADYRDELTLWRDAVAKRPGNFRAHNAFGAALATAGDYAAARREFEAVVRLAPGWPMVWCNLGEIYARTGDTNRALACFAEVIRREPDNALAHKSLAHYLAAGPRRAEALAHYRLAVSLDPDDAAGRYNFARLLEDEHPVEALAQYAAAVRLDPRDAQAHYNLANLLAAQGRPAEAVAEYRVALRWRPRDARARTNLGNLLWQKGDTDHAIRQYTEAVRWVPDLFEAQNNLAVALAERGRWAEAIAHLEQAIRLRPELPELPRQLAEWKARAAPSRPAVSP